MTPTFIGKNKNYIAYFYCNLQRYEVYYKNRLVAIKYRFRDIKNYLN